MKNVFMPETSGMNGRNIVSCNKYGVISVQKLIPHFPHGKFSADGLIYSQHIYFNLFFIDYQVMRGSHGEKSWTWLNIRH